MLGLIHKHPLTWKFNRALAPAPFTPEPETIAYLQRVYNAGGAVEDPYFANSIIKFCKEREIWGSFCLGIAKQLGLTLRNDVGVDYVTFAHDLSDELANVEMPVEAYQPIVARDAFDFSPNRTLRRGLYSALINAPGLTFLSRAKIPITGTQKRLFRFIASGRILRAHSTLFSLRWTTALRHEVELTDEVGPTEAPTVNIPYNNNDTRFFGVRVGGGLHRAYDYKRLHNSISVPAAFDATAYGGVALGGASEATPTSQLWESDASCFFLFNADIGEQNYVDFADLIASYYQQRDKKLVASVYGGDVNSLATETVQYLADCIRAGGGF